MSMTIIPDDQPAPEVPAAPPIPAERTEPTAMDPPKKRRGKAGTLLVGCCGGLVALTVLCCCGGLVGWHYAPGMAVSYFFEKDPLPGGTTKANPAAALAAKERACTALAAGQEAVVTPDEIAQMVLSGGGDNVTVLRVGASGDRATLDFSFPDTDEPPTYFNLHLKGGGVMDKGWFTALKIDEVVVSGHDWSSAVAGQELSTSANQSLANERSQHEEFGPFLDSTEHLAIRDGAFAAKLAPDGEAKHLLCDSPALQELVPPELTTPGLE